MACISLLKLGNAEERANVLCSVLCDQLTRLTPLGETEVLPSSLGLPIDCIASLILRKVTTYTHISVRMGGPGASWQTPI